jgi:hypothetical protein
VNAKRPSGHRTSTGADAPSGLAPAPDLSDTTSAFLRARLGPQVTVHDGALLKDWERNVVVRYRVQGAGDGTRSVIVKWMKAGATLGFSDWASLAYLSRTAGAATIAPRFYGGDVSSRVFAMEDLGGSESVDDLLRGSDHAAAERALGTLAAQTGRLRAATSEARALAPVAATAARMEDALRARWPAYGEGEELLPRWPALTSPAPAT